MTKRPLLKSDRLTPNGPGVSMRVMHGPVGKQPEAHNTAGEDRACQGCGYHVCSCTWFKPPGEWEQPTSTPAEDIERLAEDLLHATRMPRGRYRPVWLDGSDGRGPDHPDFRNAPAFSISEEEHNKHTRPAMIEGVKIGITNPYGHTMRSTKPEDRLRHAATMGALAALREQEPST